MTDVILVLNAGSSSIKYALCAASGNCAKLEQGQIDRIGSDPVFYSSGKKARPLPHTAGQTHAELLGWLVKTIRAEYPGMSIVAAGHRVVHGGQVFTKPTRLNAKTIREIQQLSPLAPSHQPHNLAGIQALADIAPAVPQVACFDTAFHRSQSKLAQLYALPRGLTDDGILRYGFHGLSYDYIASVLPEHLGPSANGRVVVAHLGNGASMCAMRNRESIATSMGFTALDGLVMGRRCGDLDPGVVLHLIRDRKMNVAEVEELLTFHSGLLGVSGISPDMRDLLESDAVEAREAIDLFIYRAARQIGSLAVALSGLDAIIFTGGIGENAPDIRAGILKACACLGVSTDIASNAQGGPRLTTASSTVAAFAIPTDEEAVIARQTLATLHLNGAQA